MFIPAPQSSVAIEPTPVRVDQVELLNIAVQLKLSGSFAEIGTYRASFAFKIMEICKPSRLYCVDPYERYDDFKDAINHERMDDLFAAAQKYMEPYQASATFLRMRSAQAATQIPDGSLDFVYIDANHS
jgi:predicted O-methyltransferase YrrM